ncbi:hypothetical protein Zmor_004993 [Zophobas morio]|uniref:Uncharacterized protein n=1 Tax=Zophobas morio TaxID=2755281 RepID=A0AA38IRD9_9CUCU|nr:hypothetical protein Zmor_004993 [Zophobas morio]
MDIISGYQLQQYEEILGEINSEFEKSEQLKREIQRAEDAVTFLKLSLASSRCKISHVNVKVFGSVTEIENLYDELSYRLNVLDFSGCKSCNFFLIEVVLTKTLLAKLIGTKWKLQIVVKGENFCISKVASIGDDNSVMEIIPVDNCVYECVVDVHLFYSCEDDWIMLDLSTINVDISYYFESYKEKKLNTPVVDNFLKITKLYNGNKNLTCFRTLPHVQTQFKCNFDKHGFVSTFIRNSYHRLSLESFSEVANDSKRVIELQFSVNSEKIVVFYHKDTNILKLKCAPFINEMLKKFFEQNFNSDLQDFTAKLRKIRSKKNELQGMDLDEILSFYQQIRRLWL